jgi:hypothetical protein
MAKVVDGLVEVNTEHMDKVNPVLPCLLIPGPNVQHRKLRWGVGRLR